MHKRHYRSRTDRMLAGVCGGLAKYFGIDPTIVRIIFVVLLFANGIGVIAYLILAIVVPLEESAAATPGEVIKENVEEIRQSAEGVAKGIKSTFAGEQVEKPEKRGPDRRAGYIAGVILVIIGIFFLLGNFNWLWWLHWGYLWPVIVIAIGLVIIFSIKRRRKPCPGRVLTAR